MSNNSQLSARQRIDSLLDQGSFVEVGSLVKARSTDFNMADKDTPADGVLTGYGTIESNLVFVYSQDASVLAGSVGEMHAAKIAKIYDMAVKMGAPVIAMIDCAGLRLQESVDALHGFGTIYAKQACASGVVVQITAVFGNCGGGAALIPAFSDFAYMTKENAALYVNSPNVLEGNHEDKLNTASAAYQAEKSGVIDEALDTELDVLTRIRNLITILPANNETDLSYAECSDDLNRGVDVEKKVDDARAILTAVSDDQFFVEAKKEYAKDMVTGFIRLNGTTVGCVANQAADGGEVLSFRGAYKAAEFVNFCDAFEIPVLTLTNVKGYQATVGQEKNMAKAVAAMTSAFANATVPKVNLITGEAYGSAYLAMNSKSIGADIEYAWPKAKLSVMDPENAVSIIYADEIAKAEDQAKAKADMKKEYAASVSVTTAAGRGIIDDIITPDGTRKRLIAAFEMLFTKCEEKPAKKHSVK